MIVFETPIYIVIEIFPLLESARIFLMFWQNAIDSMESYDVIFVPSLADK